MEIRTIADDEPPAEGQPVPPPEHPPQPVEQQPAAGQVRVTWDQLVRAVFGEQRANKILAIKRCQVCGGKVRPYTDPKVGAGSNRDYGVKPGLRCVKCGRMVTL